jgi:2-oxoglutarate-dependent dioxygenase
VSALDVEEDRVLGAMLGLAVGDALGTPVEARAKKEIERAEPKTANNSAIDLTIAATHAYGGARFDLERAADAMAAWLSSGSGLAGELTRSALERIVRGEATASDAGARALAALGEEGPELGAGNGSLMRAAPTGLVRAADDPSLLEESAALSRVTHADPRCVAACIAYNAALASLVTSGDPGGALAAAADAAERARAPEEVTALVADVRRRAQRRSDPSIGYVLVCLERAFIALRDAERFDTGLLEVICGGGDSDTAGAAAGALLGARFGAAAIPERWMARLAERAAVSEAARRCLAFRRSARGDAAYLPGEIDGAGPAVRTFEERGFVVVRDLFDTAAVARARDRFGALYRGEYESGITPDDARWREGRDPPELTREIRNVWRSDRAIARLALDQTIGRIAATLAGWSGARLNQAGVLWKAPGSAAVAAHQDVSYMDWIVPQEIITCWIALDDVTLENGPLLYAAGSHRRGLHPRIRAFDVDAVDADRELREHLGFAALTPIPIRAGWAAFHHGRLWHGSGPNRSRSDRRALGLHLMPLEARFHPTNPAKVLGRYRHLGDLEMDESFFPILWSRDGRRTADIEAFVRARALD